ncbi:MAG: homoserine dehydrogenase [Anaerolineaceae bacterium]|nr:homoserine dehydrogenase [Anaerolineaceae bacterium]
MGHYALVFVGFGNVGRALARLLLRKRAQLEDGYQITFQVNGIATGRHGMAIDLRGIDLEAALACLESGGRLDRFSTLPTPATILDFIQACPGDVLFENTPINHLTGQPATDHLAAALRQRMHAITANKGPVVHAYAELNRLAHAQGRRFLFESAVMDGAPIFSLFRGGLPCVELRGFQGILNSTSNMILERMESGESLEEAIVYAQSIGIAETNPLNDVEGWDAAVKVAALATVLMGVPLRPQDVQRTGISAITPAMLQSARESGQRWKLVCRVQRQGEGLLASVCPEQVPAESVLSNIHGTSSYVEFAMDVLPGLGIVEGNPSPETTAYGLLADMLNALREDGV